MKIRRRPSTTRLLNEKPLAPAQAEQQPRRIVSPCCARCRRGTKGFGELPCGLGLACRCHEGGAQ